MSEDPQEKGSIFDRILRTIEDNKKNKEAGRENTIRPPFPRFAQAFPGFERGKYFLWTASSGVSKTKFTKFFSITSVYRFCVERNIKFKVFYFALEESEEDFWLSFVISYLYETHRIRVSSTDLKSLINELPDDVLEKVKECEEYIDDITKYVRVFDYISNPTGIYKEVRKYAIENGKFFFQGKEVSYKELHDEYVPNDPEEFVFVITDHLSLLSPETDVDTKEKLTRWDSINKYSQDYCLKGFCKRFKYIVINVQQQEASKEKQEFYKGETVAKKLLPSLDGLADNKLTQRDCDIAWGIFSPSRYDLAEFRGYDITKLGNFYRCIIVLKDRHYGTTENYIHTFFDGMTNTFKELPRADNTQEMNKVYAYVDNLNKTRSKDVLKEQEEDGGD